MLCSSALGLVEQLLARFHLARLRNERKKEVPSCSAGRLKSFLSFFLSLSFFLLNDLFVPWPNIEYFGLENKSFNRGGYNIGSLLPLSVLP